MRLATVLLSAICATASASFFDGQQKILDDDLKVPGDNPLTYCESPEGYSLEVEKVDLTPNPPKKGEKLLIEAEGTFKDKVTEGSYALLTVKYGLIKLITLREDVCEQIANVDESCPLTGKLTVSREVDIPSEVPPGTYTATADVYDADDKHITCMLAHISF